MIRAIETMYRGYRFRSRLEARWAVFFDALPVQWEYEKEGYVISSGASYLPDFWLPQQGVWVEIKGNEPTKDEREKCSLLSRGTNAPVLLFSGQLALPNRNDYPPAPDAEVFFPDGSGDLSYLWCECDECGSLGVQFDGRSDRLPCKQICAKSDHGDKGYNFDSPRIVQAFATAMSARFEHGESGAPWIAS